MENNSVFVEDLESLIESNKRTRRFAERNDNPSLVADCDLVIETLEMLIEQIGRAHV